MSGTEGPTTAGEPAGGQGDVLHARWAAEPEPGGPADADEAVMPKVCRNMRGVALDELDALGGGPAAEGTVPGSGEPDAVRDANLVWRDRLAREGKLGDRDGVPWWQDAGG